MQGGALPLLVLALEKHKRSPRVQEQGLVVLWNLASEKSNQEPILKQGGFQAVLLAMRENKSDALVQARK